LIPAAQRLPALPSDQKFCDAVLETRSRADWDALKLRLLQRYQAHAQVADGRPLHDKFQSVKLLPLSIIWIWACTHRHGLKSKP